MGLPTRAPSYSLPTPSSSATHTTACQIISSATEPHQNPWNPKKYFLGIVWFLVVLLPSLAVVVRRLHDTGRSAWWLLIALVPVPGVIVLFVFAVFGSDPVANRYGPSHLEQESPEEF